MREAEKLQDFAEAAVECKFLLKGNHEHVVRQVRSNGIDGDRPHAAAHNLNGAGSPLAEPSEEAHSRGRRLIPAHPTGEPLLYVRDGR